MISIFGENFMRSERVDHVKILESLNDFIKTYETEIQRLRTAIDGLEKLEDMPVFRLPNWPAGIGSIEIDLGKREFNVPTINEGLRNDSPFKDLVVLVKHKSKLTIKIRSSGHIQVVLWKLKKDIFSLEKSKWQEDRWLDSNESTELKRFQCFVIFHQFLGEICKEIITQLNQNLTDIKENIKNNRTLIQAVKKSFEPLIPFVVADILNKEES